MAQLPGVGGGGCILKNEDMLQDCKLSPARTTLGWRRPRRLHFMAEGWRALGSLELLPEKGLQGTLAIGRGNFTELWSLGLNQSWKYPRSRKFSVLLSPKYTGCHLAEKSCQCPPNIASVVGGG